MRVVGLLGGLDWGGTLFSAVFALYFAANIAAARGNNAFDTAAIAAGDWPALKRFVVGMACLNVAPLLYYVWVLDKLDRYLILHPPISFFWAVPQELLILLLGIAGAGFYRIFAGVLAIRDKSGEFCFYAAKEVKGCGDKSGRNSHGFYIGPGEDVIRGNKGEIGPVEHFCGSLLYLAPPLIWYFLSTPGRFWVAVVVVLVLLSVAGLIRLFCDGLATSPRKTTEDCKALWPRTVDRIKIRWCNCGILALGSSVLMLILCFFVAKPSVGACSYPKIGGVVGHEVVVARRY